VRGACVPACFLNAIKFVGLGAGLKMALLAAWRAALGQCAPSPQACRHTSAPGRAAGGPRRDFVPQAQAAYILFKRASASARYIAARAKVAPVYICQVALFLLRQRRGATGLGELQ